MSRSRFLADEDLSGKIVTAVRHMAPKIEVVTIVELSVSGMSDDAVIEYAWQEKLLVVTHDKKTMVPAAKRRIAVGSDIHGLFVVPQTKSTRAVAESLILIGEASEFEEWRNQIVYLPL